MTRKDYELIARIIRDYGYPLDRQRLAPHFANHLSRDNPRFDIARFLKACEPE